MPGWLSDHNEGSSLSLFTRYNQYQMLADISASFTLFDYVQHLHELSCTATRDAATCTLSAMVYAGFGQTGIICLCQAVCPILLQMNSQLTQYNNSINYHQLLWSMLKTVRNVFELKPMHISKHFWSSEMVNIPAFWQDVLQNASLRICGE